SNCLLDNFDLYRPKHNPAAYYVGGTDRAACNTDDVDYAAFDPDHLPTLAFITPNLIDDTHDGTVAQGDAWAATNVEAILNGADYRAGRTALLWLWDENSYNPNVIVAPRVVTAPPAAAAPRSAVVVLPGATAAEGIAGGPGSTFFAGDLFTGDIFRGDLQHGTAELFIDAPDTRQAAGMKFDPASGLLFVAGMFTGQGYVYDTATGSTVALYQFADPADGPVINDVTITREGAWFTDSIHPTLYFVPLAGGVPGPFRALALSGPAAEINGQFSLNGIAATADGATLVVAHTGNASLYTVDPATGASALIEGVSVPNVDGIVLNGP